MIEVQGVSKSYGELQALDNISLTVEKGQIVGFLGANGAGKTTTMDIICGCIGPDSGSVKVSGFDILEHPLEAKQRLGYLPDTPPLFKEMLVRDYIEYSALLRNVKKSDMNKSIDSVLEKLSLGDVQKRLIGNLSKGFRQRVAFAQAIVHDPDVLVLDEPTEGLDPMQIVHIRELIAELRGDHTVILSSHILSEVENTCDHIAIIHKGKIAQQGTYSELVAAIQAGAIYRLRVKDDLGSLLPQLSSLDGLANVSKVGEGIFEFAVSNDDDNALDQVAKTVVDGKFGLKELAQKSKNLEDIFFHVTN